VPGVRVTAFDAVTGRLVRTAETNVFGHYHINGLYAGSYKVRASRPGWITTWAEDEGSKAEADVITLYAGQIAQVPPMTIYAAAAIKGVVYSWSDPLEGATVKVFDAATGRVVGSEVSDGSGNYTVRGLPPGSYKVRGTKPGYMTSWANGRPSWHTAAVYTLVAGQTLSGEYGGEPYLDLAPLGTVAGNVLGISDAPENPWDDPLRGVTVTAYDAVTGAPVKSDTTDELGNYRIGDLPFGSYRLRAAKPGWVTTWASGVHHVAFGTTSVDFVIYAAAAMKGQVLGNFDPLGGATVTVFDANTGLPVKSLLRAGAGARRLQGQSHQGGMEHLVGERQVELRHRRRPHPRLGPDAAAVVRPDGPLPRPHPAGRHVLTPPRRGCRSPVR
jgi:hypothetical protein